MSTQAKRQASGDESARETRRRARRLVRGVCLLATVLLLWPVVSGASLPALVAALSPFVATASLLATGALHVMACAGLVVGLLVLVRPRWFCRWACPLGLCLDGVSRLGRRMGRRNARVPAVGPWIVLLTLGGACLGYPVLLWLDPLAIFSGLFSFGRSWPAPSVFAFSAIALLSLLWPDTWCGGICPLGAMQDLLSWWRRVARSIRHRTDAGTEGWSAGPTLARRTALGIAAGAVWAWTVGRARAETSRPLRPPGAVDESKLAGLCTRCGNCLRACPTRIIERDLGESGWAGLLTPVLSFRDDYCREDCVRCTEVCPSGALRRLSPEDKANVRIGLPRVDMNVCLLGEDRECSACARWCPYDAIRYIFSEAEYALTPQIDAKKCTGCGACEAACPMTPQKAIVVVPA